MEQLSKGQQGNDINKLLSKNEYQDQVMRYDQHYWFMEEDTNLSHRMYYQTKNIIMAFLHF